MLSFFTASESLFVSKISFPNQQGYINDALHAPSETQFVKDPICQIELEPEIKLKIINF